MSLGPKCARGSTSRSRIIQLICRSSFLGYELISPIQCFESKGSAAAAIVVVEREERS